MVQMKLYYTPPNLERENTNLAGFEEDTSMIDWNARFDGEERHGGHRYRHI